MTDVTDQTREIGSDLRDKLAAAIQSVRSDIRNSYSLIAVAQQLLAAGFVAEAARVAESAAKAAPDDANVLGGASTIIASSQDLEACAALSERAIRLAPMNAGFKLHYGGILLGLREPRKAAEQLEGYLALQPDSPIGWRNLSSALAEIGEFHRALAAADKAIALDPNNADFRLHRSGILNILGRMGDALADLEQAEMLAPANGFIPRVMSSVLAGMNDSDAALKYARKALALDPGNVEYQGHEKQILEQRSFLDAALQAAEQSAEVREAEAKKIALRLQNRKIRYRQPWLEAIKSQSRIIFALLLREMRTRFGETQLGFAWAIIEPISHLALIAIVFSATQIAQAPVGDSLLVYYFTGVVPYLLFSNTTFQLTYALVANDSLLQIPIITYVDVLIARACVEFFTQIAVAFVMVAAFVALGYNAIPRDFFGCFTGFTLIWLMASGIGILNAVIIHFVKSWDHIFPNFVRAMYFTSGIFLSPIVMPDWVRDIVAWNPLLQGIDWIRSSFFSSYEPPWLDRGYLVLWAVGALMLGFAAERSVRRHLSVKT